MPDVAVQHAALLRARLDGPRRRYAALAAVALALTLVVIVASAYLRHVQAGVRCDVAAECVAQREAIAQARGTLFARSTHRFAASAVSLVVLAMAVMTWRQRGPGRLPRRWPALALAVVVALALLGVSTAGATRPAVTLGNLLGGYALFAILAVAHASLRPPARASDVRKLAIVALAVGFAQAAMGAVIEPQSALHVLHRVHGIVLAGVVALLIVRLWSAPDFLASALTMTLAVGVAAGIAAALAPWALGAMLLHGALAAVLLALLARAATR
jgi:cytochrome c oxidase assembly protein subunit 15